MTIHFQIPDEIERELAGQVGDVNEAAKTAFIIESYRAGRLSIGQVARVLGLATRFEAESWLGHHGVTWNYSVDELEADRQALQKVLGEAH